MGTTIYGVYIPSQGETDWLDAGELNDSLALLGKRTRNLPESGDIPSVDIGSASGVVVTDSDLLTITASGAASVSVTDSGSGEATVDVSATDTDTNTQAFSLADSGTTTLTQGKATATTSVATDNNHYTVTVDPGGADIAVSLDGTGSQYVIHIEENSSQIGNPDVGWQLMRSEL